MIDHWGTLKPNGECSLINVSHFLYDSKYSLVMVLGVLVQSSAVKILACGLLGHHYLNTLRPRHKGRHFADDIFKCIFFNENVRISIKISLKFVPKGPISNIPALIQIMAWRRTGDKPLSETMMVRLLTHICVTRPQWVKKHLSKFKITDITKFSC